MPHFIVAKACAVCGACEAECPTGAAVPHEGNLYYVIIPELCNDCGDCVEVCPTEAVKPAPESPGCRDREASRAP